MFNISKRHKNKEITITLKTSDFDLFGTGECSENCLINIRAKLQIDERSSGFSMIQKHQNLYRISKLKIFIRFQNVNYVDRNVDNFMPLTSQELKLPHDYYV